MESPVSATGLFFVVQAILFERGRRVLPVLCVSELNAQSPSVDAKKLGGA